jgi:(1->4)-alpha-D-glucan 1-alpha-D-glucosylmutase
VPDFYQGCELWDFSLVDPDNRRPVDYELRKNLLGAIETESAPALFEQWHDGRIKLFLTRKLLDFRLAHAKLFAEGDFVPLKTGGTFADCCVAFLRKFENETVLVITPRLTQKIGFPPIGAAWRDTVIELPQNHGVGGMHELFTGRELNTNGDTISVTDALKNLPVAVYTQG